MHALRGFADFQAHYPSSSTTTHHSICQIFQRRNWVTCEIELCQYNTHAQGCSLSVDDLNLVWQVLNPNFDSSPIYLAVRIMLSMEASDINVQKNLE